jgi:hypothetical protein
MKVFKNPDGSTTIFNVIGYTINIPSTKGMIKPVQCNHCGEVYDLINTKVIHRYSDCTTFKTPCCDVLSDDRTYKSSPDFTDVSTLIERYKNA